MLQYLDGSNIIFYLLYIFRERSVVIFKFCSHHDCIISINKYLCYSVELWVAATAYWKQLD